MFVLVNSSSLFPDSTKNRPLDSRIVPATDPSSPAPLRSFPIESLVNLGVFVALRADPCICVVSGRYEPSYLVVSRSSSPGMMSLILILTSFIPLP